MSSFNRMLTWRKTALNTGTNVCHGDGYAKLAHNLLTNLNAILGCVRLGNPDFGFAIEREMRKRISPPRNPSSGWISIRKSNYRFHGFPFYRSIGKTEKGFAKLFSWTAVYFLLIMRGRTRPLFLRTVFQILFFDFPIERWKWKSKNRYLSVEIRISFLLESFRLKHRKFGGHSNNIEYM